MARNTGTGSCKSSVSELKGAAVEPDGQRTPK